MMGFDRKYLIWSLTYFVAGMGVGVFMASSHDHAQNAAHAHILLVGFVVSLAYSVIHKLWLGKKSLAGLSEIQFIVHQAGTVTMSAGLLLLYSHALPDAQLDSVLAIASMAVLLGALLMLFMVLKTSTVRT